MHDDSGLCFLGELGVRGARQALCEDRAIQPGDLYGVATFEDPFG